MIRISTTWSDLIILVGTAALEIGANITMIFCNVGRADLETADDGWKHLEPRIRGRDNETVEL